MREASGEPRLAVIEKKCWIYRTGSMHEGKNDSPMQGNFDGDTSAIVIIGVIRHGSYLFLAVGRELTERTCGKIDPATCTYLAQCV